MEQFHVPAKLIANDIDNFTASYPSPGGKPWNSRVLEGARKESYVVRAWDSVAHGNHLCWLRFSVRESDDTAVMDVTICSEEHGSKTVKEHIVNSLWATYGSN